MIRARPDTLVEVSRRVRESEDTFGRALAEFMDAFYLEQDNHNRRRMLADRPEPIGNGLDDLWLGAVAEHLSGRWDLGEPPEWVDDDVFSSTREPAFYPTTPKLRGKLIVESPPAFRRRLLFTNAEPLMRARFPRHLRAVMPFADEPDRLPQAKP